MGNKLIHITNKSTKIRSHYRLRNVKRCVLIPRTVFISCAESLYHQHQRRIVARWKLERIVSYQIYFRKGWCSILSVFAYSSCGVNDLVRKLFCTPSAAGRTLWDSVTYEILILLDHSRQIYVSMNYYGHFSRVDLGFALVIAFCLSEIPLGALLSGLCSG